DGVERGALAQVVPRDEEREPAPTLDALVLPDAPDERRVRTRSHERGRDVRELDSGGVREELPRPLRGDRALELGVDRQRVAGEHRDADARAGDRELGQAEDLAGLVAQLLLLVGLLAAVVGE